MAVQKSDRGMQILLMDQMCMDKHVADFLLCLECWLKRSFGEPSATGRPWKIACLDLSRNGLSDEKGCSVFATLKRLDVRFERLLLSGNHLGAKSLEVLTQYLWNCPEAFSELDLADNDVVADPTAGEGREAGSDVVSALLRCIYNHSAYPFVQASGSGRRPKAVPLLFKFKGNFVVHPKRLLKDIQSKGGKDHVRLCTDMEAYSPTGREFLSLYAPDFSKQRKLSDPSTILTTATPSVAVEPVSRKRHRSRSHSKDRSRKKDKKKSSAVLKSKSEGTISTAHLTTPGPSLPMSIPNPLPQGPRPLENATIGHPSQDGLPWIVPHNFDREAQNALEKEVYERLGEFDGIATEESARQTLAEFAVCMIAAKKGIDDLEKELEHFLGPKASRVMTKWLTAHLQTKFGRPSVTIGKSPVADNVFQ